VLTSIAYQILGNMRSPLAPPNLSPPEITHATTYALTARLCKLREVAEGVHACEYLMAAVRNSRQCKPVAGVDERSPEGWNERGPGVVVNGGSVAREAAAAAYEGDRTT